MRLHRSPILAEGYAPKAMKSIAVAYWIPARRAWPIGQAVKQTVKIVFIFIPSYRHGFGGYPSRSRDR
jgi:hypothetical protein